MPHHTQTDTRPRGPADGTATVIDLQRRRQSRGRRMLAAGTTVAYFPDTGRTIRVTTDPDHLLAVATAPSPIGRDWATCARLRCQPIGFIDHRWAVPSFIPIAPEARCGSEAAAWAKLARKGLDAYYHVLKGYELDPGDGIIANPDPAWVDDEPATALL